jgi:ATP-binding cassette subfamily B protein/subfamily B ATP-binding cassette protein MsbA
MSNRPIEMESLLLFYGFLIGATEPARKLSDVFNSLQAGIAAADRLFPLLDREPTVFSPDRPKPVPQRIETVVLEHVDFHYTPEQPVLSDVNLTIEAGETIAIVGPNGCGKTTLASLLPRFCDPVRGAIRINDCDLREMHLRDLRGHIGLVTQRALLFDDTVYNNIRNGRLNASQADIIRAAKQARAHRFILDKLEKGYDTVVGTAGDNLSGGQRQRIALARAMVRDPAILILDEATSQIDLESEQLIHQALEQFARHRIVIIITHRLATLALADRIVVMNSGKIEDVGSHEQLIGRCDLYRRLHEIQFQRTA